MGRLELCGEQLQVLEDSRNLSARQCRVRRHALDVRLLERANRVAVHHDRCGRASAVHADHSVTDDAAAAAYSDARVFANSRSLTLQHAEADNESVAERGARWPKGD